MLARAYAALRDDARRTGLGIRILVCDNGSTDDERNLLQSLDIVYLNPGQNLNFPHGVQYAFPSTTTWTAVVAPT